MTPDEIAVRFINDHNMPIETDGRNYRALVAMIAETQSAEREACAKIADDRLNGCIAKCNTATRIAAAIRARR